MTRPASSSWTLLSGVMLVLLSTATWAEPPPTSGGQGARLHGTHDFENVNVPFKHFTQTSNVRVRGQLPSSPIIPVPRSCRSSTLAFVPGTGVLQGAGVGAPCPPDQLVGTIFYAPYAGRTLQLELREGRPHVNIFSPPQPPSAEGLWEFKVEWKLDGEPQPLCRTTNGFALAVPGAWSSSGELLDSADHFTFACVPDKTPPTGGGVIAKCIDWGYVPWATTQPEGARRLHQACVRMATADYCGEGKANTLDGTPIAFSTLNQAKFLPEGQPPPLPTALKLGPTFGGSSAAGVSANSSYRLEAVWAEDSCDGVRVLCLAKERWATLALDATCLDKRPLATLLKTPPCDDWTKSDLQAQGALLVSYSTFLDKALVRFKHVKTGLFFTTSSVEGAGTGKFRPAPNPAPGNVYEDFFEGPIFSPSLLPELRTKLSLKELLRCKKTVGGGRFLATACPAPYVSDGVEGLIYDAANPQIQNSPLYVWSHKTIKNLYVTSTTQPSPEYGKPQLQGYLPPLSQLAER